MKPFPFLMNGSLASTKDLSFRRPLLSIKVRCGPRDPRGKSPWTAPQERVAGPRAVPLYAYLAGLLCLSWTNRKIGVALSSGSYCTLLGGRVFRILSALFNPSGSKPHELARKEGQAFQRETAVISVDSLLSGSEDTPPGWQSRMGLGRFPHINNTTCRHLCHRQHAKTASTSYS